jgi:site-specific recombinase XerD
MSRSPCGLFAHVQSYFTEYLPKQRGASVHTVRAYRDALTMLFKFIAEQRGRGVASLQLDDIDADAVMRFLDHIEAQRSNSAATRNCRRAAIRGFFKHLLRNDLAHSQQYARVLAIPAKKARQRPATYLKAEDGRLIVNMPNQRTFDGWRDYALLLFLYNSGARVSEAAGLRWDDLQLAAPRQVRLAARARKSGCCRCGPRRPTRCTDYAECQAPPVGNASSSIDRASLWPATASLTFSESTRRRLLATTQCCDTSTSRHMSCATVAPLGFCSQALT